MYYSAETRWFFEGALPDSIAAWFDPSDSARIEAERTDEYLLLPGCTTTGVKLRESRLEIKAQIQASGKAPYGDSVTGYRDAWVKWSRPVTDGRGLRNVRSADDDRWVYVEKARRLRILSLDTDAPTELTDFGAHVTDGCQFELSTVRGALGVLDQPPSGDDWAAASPWWSLSLEAFAPRFGDGTDRLYANLDAGARYLFSSPPPLALTAVASRSYPAWLQQFVDGCQPPIAETSA